MGCRCRPLGIQGTESLFSRIGCGRVCAHLSCAGEEVALLQRLADSWRPEHDGPHVLEDAAAAVAVQFCLNNPVTQVLIELPAKHTSKSSAIRKLQQSLQMPQDGVDLRHEHLQKVVVRQQDAS